MDVHTVYCFTLLCYCQVIELSTSMYVILIKGYYITVSLAEGRHTVSKTSA